MKTKKKIVDAYLSLGWSLGELKGKYFIIGPTGTIYDVFNSKKEVDVYTEFDHYEVSPEREEADLISRIIRNLPDESRKSLEDKCIILKKR